MEQGLTVQPEAGRGLGKGEQGQLGSQSWELETKGGPICAWWILTASKVEEDACRKSCQLSPSAGLPQGHSGLGASSSPRGPGARGALECAHPLPPPRRHEGDGVILLKPSCLPMHQERLGHPLSSLRARGQDT